MAGQKTHLVDVSYCVAADGIAEAERVLRSRLRATKRVKVRRLSVIGTAIAPWEDVSHSPVWPAKDSLRAAAEELAP